MSDQTFAQQMAQQFGAMAAVLIHYNPEATVLFGWHGSLNAPVERCATTGQMAYDYARLAGHFGNLALSASGAGDDESQNETTTKKTKGGRFDG
jgi:hypothetical protein